MSVGLAVADWPTAWNPAPGATVNFERLLLNVLSALAKSSFFWRLVSLEAAINAKSRKSPVAGVAPTTVRLNCGFEVGQSEVPPAEPEMVQSVPEVLEPVSTQLVPLKVIVII